jgi:aminomethyltransferase
VVVNAGRKDADLAHVQAQGLAPKVREDLALMALQGPKAEAVLAALAPEVTALKLMHSTSMTIAGVKVDVSRSGYTGEDGFEISLAAADAARLWQQLLTDARVKPVGLGARDSLRLEAGLCLYGHELDEATSPIEAGLAWSIPKRRREQGGFIGAARVQRELQAGAARKRVGIRPEGRAPARDGTEIQDESGRKVGVITSGGFGPTVNGPVAMGYVDAAHAAAGTPLRLIVRGQAMPARVASLPFVPNRFKR